MVGIWGTVPSGGDGRPEEGEDAGWMASTHPIWVHLLPYTTGSGPESWPVHRPFPSRAVARMANTRDRMCRRDSAGLADRKRPWMQVI